MAPFIIKNTIIQEDKPDLPTHQLLNTLLFPPNVWSQLHVMSCENITVSVVTWGAMYIRINIYYDIFFLVNY